MCMCWSFDQIAIRTPRRQGKHERHAVAADSAAQQQQQGGGATAGQQRGRGRGRSSGAGGGSSRGAGRGAKGHKHKREDREEEEEGEGGGRRRPYLYEAGQEGEADWGFLLLVALVVIWLICCRLDCKGGGGLDVNLC